MILGLIEHDRGKLNAQSYEMLTLARGLAEESSVPFHAVLIGDSAEPLAVGLGAYGVDVVYLAQHDGLAEYAPAAWAQCVVQVAEETRPSAILATGADLGNEVMAHIAARMEQPMAANVTAVIPGDDYQITRVRWGGSLLEEAWLKGSPKLMTVAP
ncbi:MAG: electron transfer flavoprotein subunit alpha/FixB family protein, partial [Chloroflexi bacterium]|nr:electron transfer flavoprotein subunit alpha/FixB family protein [Chloroflexota bacterium]